MGHHRCHRRRHCSVRIENPASQRANRQLEAPLGLRAEGWFRMDTFSLHHSGRWMSSRVQQLLAAAENYSAELFPLISGKLTTSTTSIFPFLSMDISPVTIQFLTGFSMPTSFRHHLEPKNLKCSQNPFKTWGNLSRFQLFRFL